MNVMEVGRDVLKILHFNLNLTTIFPPVFSFKFVNLTISSLIFCLRQKINYTSLTFFVI